MSHHATGLLKSHNTFTDLSSLGTCQTLRSRQEDQRLEMDLYYHNTEYLTSIIDVLDAERLGLNP
jgi:hypothetical protein